MQTVRIAIVGAGLSGLYAAYLLAQRGVRDDVLIEARDALGGRIASASASGQTAFDATAAADCIDRFDLGPTWFWPDYQRQLHRLVHDPGPGALRAVRGRRQGGGTLAQGGAHARPGLRELAGLGAAGRGHGDADRRPAP